MGLVVVVPVAVEDLVAGCFVGEIEEILRFAAFGVDFAVGEISFGGYRSDHCCCCLHLG